ncbi:response regulator transcription factor [Streptomyces sp. HNM0645]|uniref:response regulator transcription factor n=1 Tax=Streptomyces sp. HNM0645 TaxID=2782343 RepID=UPI0024B756D6|nr:response regulator transcription factor [Streptomyces sp. HNM0645]MDI9884685.1 response regulator transcription factor [Streptomyces sp. HNM0645]
MRTHETRVRVVVADDHPIYREGIIRALGQSGLIEVVAEAGDGAEVLEHIRTHRPDVALVDYKLPKLDGLAVVHAVARDGLPVRVIVLSAYTEDSVVFRAVEEGAAGYLAKDATRREIVDAVLKVARGGTALPPDLTSGLMEQVRLRAAAGEDRVLLSEREQQVLRAFAEGKSVPQIAEELFLAPSTIKTHTQRLYEKLDVGDRAAAVAEAMRRGLLE